MPILISYVLSENYATVRAVSPVKSFFFFLLLFNRFVASARGFSPHQTTYQCSHNVTFCQVILQQSEASKFVTKLQFLMQLIESAMSQLLQLLLLAAPDVIRLLRSSSVFTVII